MTYDYLYYATLPFADKTYATTPKVVEKNVFTLERNGQTVTLLTGHKPLDFPAQLLHEANQELNYIIEEGTTYPFDKIFNQQQFLEYLFEHFAAILVDGEYTSEWDAESQDFWHTKFLGYFYVRPNYAGRSLHVCNGGFVVNHRRRGLGLGREMGRKYLDYAPRLGYVYSVFNLVYETNVASWKIWDSLGFERTGYVKNAAALKNHDKLVGAIVFGKDLV